MKEFLSQRHVVYKDYDVGQNQFAAQEMYRLTKQNGVPVIIIDGETIIGFNRPRLEQLLSQYRPPFGAAVADASVITAREGKPAVPGAYVGKVAPDSAAHRMGLLTGDIIIEVNQQLVTNAADFQNMLAALPNNSRLTLTILRGEKKMSNAITF